MTTPQDGEELRGGTARVALAAALTLTGGAALAFAAYGEGAFNSLLLVGVPGLLVALFVLPSRSAARSRARRRLGRWAGALVGGGLLLLAVTTPKFAVPALFIAAMYLVIGWPLAASAACVMAAAAVRSMSAAGPPAPRRTWARLSWTWLLGLVAAYGYGLSHFDDAMADVKDRVCRVDPSAGLAGHGGGQSLLPLGDTSCGADTVPGFVNPLLAVLAVLLAVSVTGYARARLRGRERPRQAPEPRGPRT
ncbi:hypothetical protein [Sphaerisporangium fuscum]|uniref:hypothetical protein n=1 Tax=Sphaerisporangium fuscum TaxID=2835868 RepID=UPI001BDC8C8C|nr:hypothetical protein [Sphaerisporangium fuscum]